MMSETYDALYAALNPRNSVDAEPPEFDDDDEGSDHGNWDSSYSNSSVRILRDYTKEKSEESSSPVNFCFRVTVGFLIMTGLVCAGVLLIETKGNSKTENTCYYAPQCGADSPEFEYGLTNNTGWQSKSSNDCCQICPANGNSTVCFNSSAESNCASKTGNNDWDFLMLDQMWQPQFCAALSQGHDPTLSHLEGSKCVAPMITSNLTIHGLWPNYYDGYPQCCHNEDHPVEALSSETVESWGIYPDLLENWPDPTTTASCSTCYLLNHEWEKHGQCYSMGDPHSYFEDGLDIYSFLEPNRDQLEKSLVSGSIVTREEMIQTYDVTAKINLICDPNNDDITFDNDETGVWLELQTCWEVLTASTNSVDETDGDKATTMVNNALGDFGLVMIDCPDASPSNYTVPCPRNIYIR